jgi:hypothetical protein
VSKKKVKGHVREKVFEKLERVTLENYDGEVEGDQEDEDEPDEE